MHLPKFSILHGVMLDIERRNLFNLKELPGYPGIEDVKSGVIKLSGLWADINKDDFVLRRLTDLTGVELQRDIEVYVIGGGLAAAAMSEPFIISTTGREHKTFSDEIFIEILIHETAHRFAGDSVATPRLKKYWDMVGEKYKDESKKAQSHIIIYALLEVIIEELFGTQNIPKYINPDGEAYQRAWQIVQEQGARNIIEEFRNSSVE